MEQNQNLQDLEKKHRHMSELQEISHEQLKQLLETAKKIEKKEPEIKQKPYLNTKYIILFFVLLIVFLLITLWYFYT